MPGKQRRERGSALEPEQRDYIDAKLRDEGLSIKAAAAKYEIAESSLRNALNGKDQDYATLEDIIEKLGVPDVNRLKERDRRLFNIPRDRNDYFTGREDKMKALCQTLEKSQFAAVTQALSGLGGIGKTATAIEYAYRCHDKADYPDYPRYKAIQFARADTVEALKYGFAEIANSLQLRRADPNNLDEAVQAVLRWMTQPEEAPWLLILDNADEPDILKDFLPAEPQRHHGHVLITSRSHHFANRIKRVDIEAMGEEEGVTFLYRRTERERIPGSKEEQAAQVLVEEMGGLPLALEQSAAYMSHEEISFEDYLTNFRDQMARSEQMMYAPEYGFYRRFQPKTREYAETLTVLTTWHMSLAKIAPDHPQAVRLLYLSAFLHPVGIPKELVVALLPDYFAPAGENAVMQNALFNRLLNVLTSYSLIQRDLDNSTHSVHVMVQTVLRDGLQLEDQKQACELVLIAVARSFPPADYIVGGRGALYYPHAELIRDYMEQAGIQSDPVGLLLNQMGSFLHYQGRLIEAETIYLQALQMRKQLLPEGHPAIATCLTNLAGLYESQGRYDEAESLSLQAREMWQKALPEDHLAIAACLNNLAGLYVSQGRYAEAEPLYLQAVEIRKNVSSEGHSTIAASLNNLAELYKRQGRYAEAEPLYLQAIDTMQKALPDGHPRIAQSLSNLATLYEEQGRLIEVEPLLQQALEMRQRMLPDGHPDIAQSLNNLAEFCRNQGRYAEAEPLYLQALEMWQKALPEGHPTISIIFNNLALLYQSQERYAEAELLFQQALLICQQAFPEGHPTTAASMNNLALLYDSQGRYSEAETLCLHALTICRRVFPDGHPTIAMSLNNLAELYRKQGRYAEAEPLCRQALEMRMKLLPKGHFSIATSMNNLAGLYEIQGRFSNAEPLCRQALEMRKKALPNNHPDLAASLNNLAMLYLRQERFAKAEPLFREAAGIMSDLLGKGHPKCQIVLTNYLICLVKMKREDEVIGIDPGFLDWYRENIG